MREVRAVFDVPGVTVAQFFATCYADGAFVKRFHSKHNGHEGTTVTPWEEVEEEDGDEGASEGELDDDGGFEARRRQQQQQPKPKLKRRRRLVQFSVPLRMPDFVVRLAGVDSISVLESQELTLVEREKSSSSSGGESGSGGGGWLRRRGGSNGSGNGASAESEGELESMQLDCSPLLDLAVAQRFAIETGGFLRVERREFPGEAGPSSPSGSSPGIRITALIRVSSGGPWGVSAAVEAAMASQARGEAVALLTLAFEALSEAAELRGESVLPPPPGPPLVSDVAVVASGEGEEAAFPAEAAAEGEEEEEEEAPLAVRETTSSSSSSDDDDEFAEEEEGSGEEEEEEEDEEDELGLDDGSSAFQDALSQPPPSAEDAEAMLRMLDSVSARLCSLEREVEAARAIVKASCPEVVEKGLAERLLSSVLPVDSYFSSWTTGEGGLKNSRSSGVAVAAAATAVVAAFVAVRGASSSRSRV